MHMGVENTSGQIENSVEAPSTALNVLFFYDRLKCVNPWPNSIQPTRKSAINHWMIQLTQLAAELVEVALSTSESAH